jgi:hypothetical protein
MSSSGRKSLQQGTGSRTVSRTTERVVVAPNDYDKYYSFVVVVVVVMTNSSWLFQCRAAGRQEGSVFCVCQNRVGENCQD